MFYHSSAMLMPMVRGKVATKVDRVCVRVCMRENERQMSVGKIKCDKDRQTGRHRLGGVPGSR